MIEYLVQRVVNAYFFLLSKVFEEIEFTWILIKVFEDIQVFSEIRNISVIDNNCEINCLSPEDSIFNFVSGWFNVNNNYIEIYLYTPMDGIQCRGSAPPPSYRICVGVLESKGWIHMKGNQNS